MLRPEAPATVRRLAGADLPGVGRLVRASFDPQLTPFMVATQRGWPDFLGVALSHPTQFPGQHLLVAELDGSVVGFADFRVSADRTGFLSYICVAPQARGRGIARHLLRDCVRGAGDLRSVALDVFEDNIPARQLYDSLGMTASETQAWWRAPLVLNATTADIVLSGLPAAIAAHERYGFCELLGTTDGRPLRCGRIGDSVLRFFSADDFDDPALTASLLGLFPELTESFTVLPSGARPQTAGAQRFNTVVRMSTHDVPRLLGVA